LIHPQATGCSDPSHWLIPNSTNSIQTKLNYKEDTASDDNPTATKVDDDTSSDNDSRLQLDEDNNSEEGTESQIPSSILRKRQQFLQNFKRLTYLICSISLFH
jgi:hypothetical protein